MKKTIAILLSGKAGVGKTTAANILCTHLDEFSNLKKGIFPIARGLKETTYNMGWGGKKDLKGRKLLQEIGRIGREYDEDIWVRKNFFEYIEESNDYPFDVVFMDDWRFPNEYNFGLTQPLYSLVKVRIESPEREILKGKPEYNDVSETSLPSGFDDPSYYDYIIDNVYDMKTYSAQLLKLWDWVLENKSEAIKWM